MPDAFERELLTDIAEADAIGDVELAGEWRLELTSYRRAKELASGEVPAWEGSSRDGRRETLDRRQPG